jgi:signal transduction histidine kinase
VWVIGSKHRGQHEDNSMNVKKATPRRRTSARARLAVMYSALFLVTGAALLGVSYKLVEARTLRNEIQVLAIAPSTDSAPIAFGPSANSKDSASLRRIEKIMRQYAPTPESLADRIWRLLPAAEQTPARLAEVRAILVDQTAGPPAEIANELNQLVSDKVNADRRKTLSELVRQSLVALVGLGATSVLLGWFFAGRVLRPVHRITATARRLSDCNLDERLNLGGPNDELRELGDTFDSMLDRIQKAFENERRLIANTSHELRTPLSVQRTLLDVTLAQECVGAVELRVMAEKVRAQTIRQQDLIERLLLLARTDNTPLDCVPVDVAAVAAVVREESDVSGIAKVNELLAPAWVLGDPVLIAQMVSNLLDNAKVHNTEHGYIDLETCSLGATARLTVANSGAILSPAQLDVIRLPFRRAARDRTKPQRGLGLGLPIVESIAHAHGGTVQLEAIPTGGLRVTVVLPTAPAPSSAQGSEPK